MENKAKLTVSKQLKNFFNQIWWHYSMYNLKKKNVTVCGSKSSASDFMKKLMKNYYAHAPSTCIIYKCMIYFPKVQSMWFKEEIDGKLLCACSLNTK